MLFVSFCLLLWWFRWFPSCFSPHLSLIERRRSSKYFLQVSDIVGPTAIPEARQSERREQHPDAIVRTIGATVMPSVCLCCEIFRLTVLWKRHGRSTYTHNRLANNYRAPPTTATLTSRSDSVPHTPPLTPTTHRRAQPSIASSTTSSSSSSSSSTPITTSASTTTMLATSATSTTTVSERLNNMAVARRAMAALAFAAAAAAVRVSQPPRIARSFCVVVNFLRRSTIRPMSFAFCLRVIVHVVGGFSSRRRRRRRRQRRSHRHRAPPLVRRAL